MFRFSKILKKREKLLDWEKWFESRGIKTEIKETIESFFGKFTIFIITHDLDLIEKADLIIVLKNGKIIESGNHKELIKKKNYYFNLHKNNN